MRKQPSCYHHTAKPINNPDLATHCDVLCPEFPHTRQQPQGDTGQGVPASSVTSGDKASLVTEQTTLDTGDTPALHVTTTSNTPYIRWRDQEPRAWCFHP